MASTISRKIIENGMSVIRQEAEALFRLAEVLDDGFEHAVQKIIETQGRVIVAGLGKSGHIGRKIAATLSATGSPAFFMHAAEAAHGDLGLLRAGDTLLILSNSGSTAELMPMVAHAAVIGIPIIAIASNATAPLMRQADIPLCLPQAAEACPERIAPTTSSTMMLALGDALAIAAMQARGTSRVDLLQWHPGGTIGKRFLPVDVLLGKGEPLPLVRPGAGMRDVVLEMTSTGKGAVGVVDDAGDLIGIITDGDLRRSFDRMLNASARELMTADPFTVPSGTKIEEVRGLMAKAKITAVFVMRRDAPTKPAGLVHIHDLGVA